MFVFHREGYDLKIFPCSDDEYNTFPLRIFDDVNRTQLKPHLDKYPFVILAIDNLFANDTSFVYDVEPLEVSGYDIDNLFEMISLTESGQYIFLYEINQHFNTMEWWATYHLLEPKKHPEFIAHLRKQKLEKYI